MDGPKRGINRKVWQAEKEVGQSGGPETLVTVLEPSMWAGGLPKRGSGQDKESQTALWKGLPGKRRSRDPGRRPRWGRSVHWSRPERVVPPAGLWLEAWKESVRTPREGGMSVGLRGLTLHWRGSCWSSWSWGNPSVPWAQRGHGPEEEPMGEKHAQRGDARG